MRSVDLLALRIFLLPADRCSSDRALKYLNFVLNVRRLVNNTQRGLSTFFKNQVLVLFWPVHLCYAQVKRQVFHDRTEEINFCLMIV